MTLVRTAVLALLTATLFCGSANANLVFDTFNELVLPSGTTGTANTGGANAGAEISTSGALPAAGLAYQFQGSGAVIFGAPYIQYLFSDTLENIAGTPSVDIINLPITSLPSGTGEHLNLEIFSLDDAAGSSLTSLASVNLGSVGSSINLGPAMASAFGLRFLFTGSTGAFVQFGDPGGSPGLMNSSVSMVANPEPTAFLMFGSAMGLGLIRRRKA